MDFKKISVIIAFLSLFSMGYAQETRPLTGVVKEVIDGKEELLIGVNVVLSNEQDRTLKGTITNMDGEYVIMVPQVESPINIVFTFIGMKPMTFKYTGQTTLDVVLENETKMLENLVVSGKRAEHNELGLTVREQTFSTQKIQMGEIVEALPVTNVEEALQGQIAGLDILAGGDPGSRSSIRIRGTATLNSTTDPLIVVNGVPYSSQIDDNFDFNTANDEDFASMLNLNPNDIESIEVLKDAASTSIYGTAGANGVLLITTKKGTKSKTRFSFSSKYSVKFEPDPMPMLSGDQYTSFIGEAIWNTANAKGVTNTSELLDLLYDTPEINYMEDWRYFNEYNQNTDWLSYVRQNAVISDNSFSMSGGGEKATYRFSLSYSDEGGTTVGTGLQRITSNLNVGYSFSKKLRVEADFSLSNFNKQNNWTTAVRAEALRKMPNKSPYWMTEDENGNIVESDNYFTRQNSEEFQGAFTGSKNFHPIIMANESFNNTKQNEERIIIRMNYDVLKELRYSGYVSMKFRTTKNRKFLPQAATDVSMDNEYANNSTDSYSNNLDLQTENRLTFRKNWNLNHNLVATALWRTAQSTSSNYAANIYGAPTGGMSDPVTGGAVSSINSSNSEGRTLSGIASLNYTLFNRYVFSATINQEGKTSLGKDERWGSFPSVGVAWHVYEEPFMTGVSWINQWKIRVSYGMSGQAPSGTAPYVGTYSAVGRYISKSGIAPSSMQLNNLKWENSTEYDIGTDLSLFEDKLTMTFDYYHKYTTDLLQKEIKIPSSAGFDAQDSEISYYNSGELSNQGIEYRIDYTPYHDENWRITTSFNIAKNVNKIEKLPENLQETSYSAKNGEYAQRIIVGTPTGSFFGYKYLGVYQNVNDTYAKDINGEVMYDLDGDPIVMKNVTENTICYPGDAKYEDVNKDGIINEKDIVYIGNSMPLFNGGAGANISYKNLGLRFNFHYRVGQKIINEARMNSESMYGTDNQSTAVLRRWRNEGDDTDIPRALWKYGYNYLGSDRFVEDCSFIRLQSVSLNYRIPKTFCQKIHVNSLNLFVTVYDLFTWTKYSGMDPEVNLPSSVTDLAVDDSQTPRSTRFSAGLNLSF